MKNIKSLFIIVLLFAGCTPHKKNSSSEGQTPLFPADLLYKGQPIHPCKVLATQFGDCIRFEPSSVECGEDGYAHQLTFTYPYVNEIRREKEDQLYGNYECEDEYRYVGSYQNKYIIRGLSCAVGTGRFEFLTLLKREGNTIVNAGEIAAGDRGYGGIINIISLDSNILRYSQSAPIDTIVRVLINESMETFFSAMVSGVSLVYEVNLDAPISWTQFDPKYGECPSQVIGLLFDQGGYGFSDDPDFGDGGTIQHTREQIERYFYATADKYVKNGKRELNLDEARIFAQEALCDIQENMGRLLIYEK